MKYKFTLCIGVQDYQKDFRDIPLDEYDPSKDDRNVLDEIWTEWAWDYIEGNAQPVEEEEG